MQLSVTTLFFWNISKIPVVPHTVDTNIEGMEDLVNRLKQYVRLYLKKKTKTCRTDFNLLYVDISA